MNMHACKKLGRFRFFMMANSLESWLNSLILKNGVVTVRMAAKTTILVECGERGRDSKEFEEVQ